MKIKTNDFVKFRYHNKLRKGKVIEVRSDFCTIKVNENTECKNFRYDKMVDLDINPKTFGSVFGRMMGCP